jgi:hypothetical protein
MPPPLQPGIFMAPPVQDGVSLTHAEALLWGLLVKQPTWEKFVQHGFLVVRSSSAKLYAIPSPPFC